MKLPTLSVVIPTANGREVLGNALTCIARGSERPQEVLVVDDGSAEPVANKLRPGDFPFPLTIIRHPSNRGAAAARNTGLRAATGEVVLLVDDDILLEADTVLHHKRLHARHASPGYAVLGRVTYDPLMTRTVLLDYLEELGAYRWLAKRREGELFRSGILTANLSLKRIFLEGKELFDEAFPYNRNEDTEFGLRMMRQGMEPRYHYAPSARHHSPLTLAAYQDILTKSGVCKGHWSLAKPDDTPRCQQLLAFLQRGAHREHLQQKAQAVLDALGYDFAERAFDEVLGADYLAFADAAGPWFASIEEENLLAHWRSRCAAFARIEELIAQRRAESVPEKKAALLKEAYQAAPGFLPMALAWAEDRVEGGAGEEALRALEPFDGIWVNLRRAAALNQMGAIEEASETLAQVLESTDNPTEIALRQHCMAAGRLCQLAKGNTLGAGALPWVSHLRPRIGLLEELVRDENLADPIRTQALYDRFIQGDGDGSGKGPAPQAEPESQAPATPQAERPASRTPPILRLMDRTPRQMLAFLARKVLPR